MVVSRTTQTQEVALRRVVSAPQPVWPRIGRAESFRPLVLLLAAIAPAFVVSVHGVLGEISATWGWIGLEVLDGHWRVPVGLTGDPTPPILAWSWSTALSIPYLNPLVAVQLPAIAFALGSLALVYVLGRVWFTAGTGIMACFLIAVNPFFLDLVQRGDPSLIVLFFAMLSLVDYARHLQFEDDVFSWWTVLGVLSFTGLLLTLGIGAICFPLIGIFNVFFRELGRHDHEMPALRHTLWTPTTRAGYLVVSVGAVIALPWFLTSGWHRGPWSPWLSPINSEVVSSSKLLDLVWLMPVTFTLACYGFASSLRKSIRATRGTGRSAFLLFWSTTLIFAFPILFANETGLLLLLVPLTFYASRTLIRILRREVSDSRATMIILFSCWLPIVYYNLGSDWIRRLVLSDPEPIWLDLGGIKPERWLRLHLVIDALLITTVVVWCAFTWAKREDRRLRFMFGGYVAATLIMSLLVGVVLVDRPLRRNDTWQKIYLQLKGHSGIDSVAFLGAKPVSAELRFLARAAFPKTKRVFIQRADQLDSLLESEKSRPLILVTESSQKLSRTYPITKGDWSLTMQETFDSPQVVVFAPIEQKP